MRIRRRTSVLATGLAFAIALLGRPSAGWAAPSEEVRARARRAAAAIADGRLAEADAMIEANLEANPDPFVYLLGALREQQGDCPGAVEAYRRYMALDVAEQDVAAAQAGVERCTDKAGGDSGVADPETTGGHTSVDDPTAGGNGGDRGTTGGATVSRANDDELDPRWWADPVGLGLSVGGGAVLIAGAVTWSQTGAQSRAAEDAGSLSTYERHGRRAEILQGVGVGLVATGAALLVGGAIRYGLVASRSKRRGSNAAMARLRPAAAGFVLTF